MMLFGRGVLSDKRVCHDAQPEGRDMEWWEGVVTPLELACNDCIPFCITRLVTRHKRP